MFEGEAHRSYLQLCRELRLEPKEWRTGDWCIPLDGEIACVGSIDYDPLPESDHGVWLPTLADLLSMLEEAGYPEVAFCARAIDMERYLYGAHPDDMDRFTGWLESREEAAAHLWMAVTGRTVTSG